MKLFFISILAVACWIKPAYAQTGGALNFTNGDYVDLGPSFNAFNFNNSEFTIETWFKTSMSNGTIISKRSVCNVSNFWNLRISAGSIRFEMMEAGGANAVDVSTPLTYNDNTWHHVAVTRSSNAVKIIMDGYVVVNNTSAANTSLTNTTDPIRIGQSACNNFIGELDETRIWSEARTVCEIYENKDFEFNSTSTTLKFNAHYNQGIAGGSNGAVTSVINSASNGIAGSLVSFALTGSTSNWVASACPAQGQSSQPISISNVSACGSYSWGGTTYTSSGTYNKIFLVSNSCDSLAQLNLTINQPPSYSVVMGSTSVCAGSGTTMTVSNAPQLTYCTPTTTGNVSNNDFISWFTFGGISKTSGDGPGVYNYYSTEFANVTAGSVYSYSLFFGGSNAMGTAIWIDYNQDGDFSDAGEYVASTGSSIFGPLSNFTIPANAPNGHTRLRVACRRGATPAANQSCGGFDFGEFEDYNILISGGSASPNSFTWSPVTFLNTTTGYTVSASNMTATTTYTITGTDQNGCSASVTRTVVVNPLPATPTITSSANSICGGTTLQMQNAATYCTPTVSGGNLNGQHFISLFTLGSNLISNTSGDGPGVYNDYSTQIASLNVGTPYAFNLLAGGSVAMSKAIWIDINHDGDFSDAGEFIASLNSSQSTGTLIIPSIAYNGLTRMRVAVSNASGIISGQSCSGFVFGEYEDYRVQISGGDEVYTWAPASPLSASTGNPVQIINQTANTIYTLTVTDANGCTKSDVHTVNFLAAPNVTISATADSVCSGLPVTLTASGASSYVWNPSITNGVPFTPSATTTYTVTGTASNGCTKTNTKEVKVNASPAVPVITAPSVFCNGSTALLTTANYCIPTTSPQDTFSNPHSISAFYLADTLIGTSLIGTKIISTTNLDSSYSNFTDQVAVLDAGEIYIAVILPQGTQPLYFVTLIDYNQDGVFNLTNEVVHSMQTPSATGQAGYFLVPATAKSGLTRMRTIVSSHDFGANAACSIYDPSNANNQAYGETEDYSIFINGGEPSSLSWAPATSISNTLGNSTFATLNGTTTYTVTATSASGCTSTATKTIVPTPGPNMTISSSAPGVCLGNPITLTASGAASYVWSDSILNGIPFTPTATKTYSVIGTSSQGCKDTAYKQIFVDSIAVVPGFNSPGTCTGQAVSFDISSYCLPIVSNNSPTNDYIDTFTFNGNDLQNFSGEEESNYSYYSNGVINTTVNSLNLFTIGVGGIYATQKAIWIDFNQDGDFSDNGEFVFSAAASTNSVTGSILIPTNVSSGKTRMRVLCARSSSNPLSGSSCNGVNYGEYEDYIINISGGINTHVWAPANLLTETAGSRITTVPLSANTTFTVTTTSTYGCTASATRTVDVESNPSITASVNPTTVCTGDSIQLQNTPAAIPKSLFFDFDSAPGIINSAAACVFNIQANNDITITSLKGRLGTSVSRVQIWYKPGGYGNANVTSSSGWIKLGSDIPILEPNLTDMTAIPLTQYLKISSGQTFGIMIITNGHLSLHPETTLGAVYTSNADISLMVGQMGAAFNLVSAPKLWYGEVNYVLGNIVSQQWSPTFGLTDSSVHNPKAVAVTNANYQVTVTTANGCTTSSSIPLTVTNLPTITINTSADSICLGSSTTLNSSGALNYTWQPGNLSGPGITVSPLVPTTYTVTGTSAQGCIGSNTRTIHINPLPNTTVSVTEDTICAGASVQLLSSFTYSNTLSILSSLGPSITILDNAPANPFPANLSVSGLQSGGLVLKRVYLNGLSHTYLSDVDMWLMAPNGQIVMLMSDVGISANVNNVNLILEDNQPLIPSNYNVSSGLYSPTNNEVNWNNEPTNPSTTLSSFAGNFNGDWKLFIRDDEGPDMGSLTSFQLEFVLPDTIGYSINWLANPVGNQSSLSSSSAFYPIASPVSSTSYSAAVTNSYGCTDSASILITVVPCNTNLALKLFIEGYYAGSQEMHPVKLNQGIGNSSTDVDQIEVELRQATAPFALVASTIADLKTNGTAQATFSGMYTSSYYVVVKSRNGIETWSADPILMAPGTTFDYSVAANEAYGSNQSAIASGVWAIFSGDINQDGVIDGLDYNDWELDNNNFGSGYLATDLNGDGIVDGLDFLFWEQNSNNFVGAVTP